MAPIFFAALFSRSPKSGFYQRLQTPTNSCSPPCPPPVKTDHKPPVSAPSNGSSPCSREKSQVYQIFADEAVRRQCDDYDAVAVIDWQSVEVQEDSFARLYAEVFDSRRPQCWWVMAADAPALEAGEADGRREAMEKAVLRDLGRNSGDGGGGGGGGGGEGARFVWSVDGRVIICEKPTFVVPTAVLAVGGISSGGDN